MVNSESVILKSEKSTYQINNISTCIILLLSLDAIYRIYPSSIVDICLLSLADWITGHRHGDFICIHSYYISNQLNYFFPDRTKDKHVYENQQTPYYGKWRGCQIVFDAERSNKDYEPPAVSEGIAPSLAFESRFECGNLRQARRV